MTQVISLLLTYRYLILIPLSIVEGPVVAFLAGTFAAGGYFNIYLLAILFFVRDMAMDGFYYSLGYFGNKYAFTRKLLAKMGVTEEHFAKVRAVWEKHPMQTMFFGKLAYGIATGFIVLAGAVRMQLSIFFSYGAIVAVLQYGTLLLLGYFFGNALGGSMEHIIKNVQYGVGGLALLVAVYWFFGMRMRKSLRVETDA